MVAGLRHQSCPYRISYPEPYSPGPGADCGERAELQGAVRHPARQGVVGGVAKNQNGGKFKIGPLDACQRIPGLGAFAS